MVRCRSLGANPLRSVEGSNVAWHFIVFVSGFVNFPGCHRSKQVAALRLNECVPVRGSESHRLAHSQPQLIAIPSVDGS
jgi:hypothetical protein